MELQYLKKRKLIQKLYRKEKLCESYIICLYYGTAIFKEKKTEQALTINELTFNCYNFV